MRKAERCISVYNTVISSNLLPERCATQRTNEMSFWRITRVRWVKEQKINWNKLLAFYWLLISKLLQILHNPFLSFFFFTMGNKPLSGRTDGWSIHRCRTLLQDPRKPTQSDFIDVVSTGFFRLCVVGFWVCVSDRSQGLFMYSVFASNYQQATFECWC